MNLVALGVAVASVMTIVIAATLSSPRPERTEHRTTGAAAIVAAPPAEAVDGFRTWALLPDGTPLRWDACRPIEFVLSLDGLPTDVRPDVTEALDRLSRASGLELRLMSTTEERPRIDRPLVVRDGAGWRWSPVLIGWMSPAEAAAVGVPLETQDRGVALPISVRDGDRESYVTGQVVLNAQRADLVAGFSDRTDAWGATLLHELAHLLGLAHVDDGRELMATDPGRGPVAFGPGDLAGLAAVGAVAGCNSAPDPAAGRSVAVPRRITP